MAQVVARGTAIIAPAREPETHMGHGILPALTILTVDSVVLGVGLVWMVVRMVMFGFDSTWMRSEVR